MEDEFAYDMEDIEEAGPSPHDHTLEIVRSCLRLTHITKTFKAGRRKEKLLQYLKDIHNLYI